MDIEKVAAIIVDAAFKVHKAVEQLVSVHQAQLLTYLKLSRKTLGFLINFNVAHLKDGLHRVVLNHSTVPLRAPSRPSR